MNRKEITAADIKSLMLSTYRRFANGEISENKAYKENVMLANILKAIEVSETQMRLQAIEAALRLNDNSDLYDNGEE